MKFKALRTNKEPKEFVHFDTYAGKPAVFTSSLPNPMPITATMNDLNTFFAPDLPIDLDDVELVEFECTEISCEQL